MFRQKFGRISGKAKGRNKQQVHQFGDSAEYIKIISGGIYLKIPHSAEYNKFIQSVINPKKTGLRQVKPRQIPKKRETQTIAQPHNPKPDAQNLKPKT